MEQEKKALLDFTPVLCTKSGMGFEAGKVYAAYDHKLSKGVIRQGEFKSPEGFELPQMQTGLSIREAIGGYELYSPWDMEVKDELPVFALNAFTEPLKTNREKLMEELDALDAVALYMEFADNRTTRAIDDAICADCKARRGRCAATSDDTPCPVTIEDWMGQEAREAAILPKA